jgi:hypothetical protein
MTPPGSDGERVVRDVQREVDAALEGLIDIRDAFERFRKIGRLVAALARPAPAPSVFDLERRDRADAAMAVLTREGWRYCDIPACNCGSWHRPASPAPSRESEGERVREMCATVVESRIHVVPEDATIGERHATSSRNEMLGRLAFLIRALDLSAPPPADSREG